MIYLEEALPQLKARPGSLRGVRHGILALPQTDRARITTHHCNSVRHAGGLERTVDAYLDIETTGLSPFSDRITVVGIYRETAAGFFLRQLVGQEVTAENVLAALAGVEHLYTYNGDRFDLVFIQCRLGIELKSFLAHTDLMRECWDKGLYGGFKAVERQLGIGRALQGVSGRDAVILWWRYVRNGDARALQTLLDYNREDVVNLKTLRERLETTVTQ